MCVVFLFILGGILLLNANNTSNNNSLSLHSGQNQANSSSNYNFTANEVPAFNFPSVAYASDLKNNVSVHNFKGEVIQANINVTTSGNGSSVQVSKTQQFTPGKYSLVINRNGKKIEQDFTWGVLAINPNKSIYKPGETANIALAVLDEKGKMVCDGQVTLEIKNPSGQTTTLSVQNKTITVNPECQQKKYTVNPDYETKYQVGLPGIYQMSLTAVIENGTYNIVDFFTVEENPEYDVERITATRIFPYSIYPVSIKITANKDFSGQIRELAPTSLTITPLKNTVEYTNIQEKDGVQYILWNVSLKKGETINIGYNYKPPLISPQFYLLGPLSLISGNTPIFEEKRAWQLAIDSLDYSQTILNTTGLVSYWRLGETSGNPQDSKGTNHVTVVNGTPTYGQTGAIAGDSNKAITFSASTDYFTVPDAASLDLGNGPFSIEAWARRDTDTGVFAIAVNKGINAYSFGWTNNDKWELGMVNVNPLATESNTTAADGTWHHFVVTRTNSTTMNVYKDGVDVTTLVDTTRTLLDTTSVLEIGIETAGSLQPLAGALDELAIYNTVLSAATVLDHYNTGVATSGGNFRFNGIQLNGLRIN